MLFWNGVFWMRLVRCAEIKLEDYGSDSISGVRGFLAIPGARWTKTTENIFGEILKKAQLSAHDGIETPGVPRRLS